MIKLDVLGFKYDDSEPAFTLLGGGAFYYHIAADKVLEKNSFDAKLTAEGKAFAAGELGYPSAAWQATHDTLINRTGTKAPPVPPAAPGASGVDGSPEDEPSEDC